MVERKSGGCTLDCFDCCKFNVYVENEQVKKIEGDPNHPYTKGFICKKGRAHLERHNHPDRQFSPLRKVNGNWQEISFDEALSLMAEKLLETRENYGSQSVLYYEQYGSGSILKSIGDIFFNFYGGCAKQAGGPCWSAGIEAQKQNFGDVRSHSLEDMLNSNTIIVWGKNPAETSIHTMQMIKKAKGNGSYVIVIDPIKTATARQADYYVQIKPGGDGALALAMAKHILETGKEDRDFLSRYVNGLEAYQKYLASLLMDTLLEEAGVSMAVVEFLVERYTKKYATILLGYGLQKYYHGGNTIQLIDSLGALTGQIGEKGGGVNYANRVYPDVLDGDPYHSLEHAKNIEFQTSKLEAFVKEQNIQMAVIVKSNLVTQLPGGERLEQTLKEIPFSVCFDQFLTDTAECCELFIPVTTVLESEDLLYSSMTNPYLIYIEEAVKPKSAYMDEYIFFQELARRMNLQAYPMVNKKEYLSKVIAPLRTYEPQMSLNYLKEHYFTLHKSVPWSDKQFATNSGKFELLFRENIGKQARKPNSFRLLTTHTKHTLFSQHYMDKQGISVAYVNEKMASRCNMADGENVWLASGKGKIQVKLQIDDSVCDDVVRMDVGWWKKHGNPNWILESGNSDIGGQVTYHENEVMLYKIK